MDKWKYKKSSIWIEEIHLKIGVALSDEKMRKSHLRWFGHVQRRGSNALARKSKFIQVEEMKNSRGTLKITLVEVVKKGHVN